jgi:hypothetical protein
MSSQRSIIGCTADLDPQAGDYEGSEKDPQKTLSGASEGDGLALGVVEGLSSAGASAIANLQGVTSRFDFCRVFPWVLDGERHLQCPQAVAAALTTAVLATASGVDRQTAR